MRTSRSGPMEGCHLPASGAVCISGLLAVMLVGCDRQAPDPQPPPAAARDPLPIPPTPRIGHGPRYMPPPARGAAAHGEPVGRLRCETGAHERYGTHLEIFARGLDMVIPAGIGIAPPRDRDGAYVTGGRCSYPVRTVEPTGLIEVRRGLRATLGEFFDLWGQPLSRTRLVGFSARRGKFVSAYVNGRRWKGDPRLIPLRRHTAIVLEVSGYFPPTRVYAFPPAL